MIKKITLMLILWGYILAAPIQSQVENIQFEHINFEQGLIFPFVTSMVQDQQGFLWIGTGVGLARYDGYEFNYYLHDPTNSNTLTTNAVWELHLDKKGMLWVGLSLGGINMLDPKTGQITGYQHDPGDPSSLSSNESIIFCASKNGLLWVGMVDGGGLNLFNTNTGKSVRYKHKPGNANSLSDNYIRFLVEDTSSTEGVLWIGSYGGLSKYEYEKDLFTHYKHDPNNPSTLSDNWVEAIEFSKTGDLWVGTNNGLDRFNPIREEFIHFKHDPNNSNSITENRIRALKEDSSGDLWVGTRNGTLNKLTFGFNNHRGMRDDGNPPRPTNDSQEHQITRFEHDPSDPNSLSKSIWIITIYEDNAGSIWIGTYGGGISKYDRNTAHFTNYSHNKEDENSLGPGIVGDIVEDNSGKLWIAAREGGLNKFDRKNKAFTNYSHIPGDPNSLLSNDIRSLLIDPDDNDVLWIVSDRELTRYSISEGRFESILNQGSLYEVKKDKYENLWLGTWGDGLYKYELNTGILTNFRHDPSDSNSVSDNYCRQFVIDHSAEDTVLWISTFSGLNRFDTRSKTVKRYPSDPHSLTSLADNGVNSVYEDRDGFLWIATQKAIHKYDKRDQIFTRFTPLKEYINPHFYSLIMDDEGILWSGSTNGLWRFNPRNEIFKRFTAEDGLAANSNMAYEPFYDHSTGEMFFGGTDGLSSFYPQKVKDNPFVPPVVLTSFKIFTREASLDTLITYINEISLTHDQNVFSFEFAALNYIHPERNQYAYKMVGFDREWVNASNKRDVTYTNLNSGSYVFQVMGSNNDGVWNEEPTSIRITILPPWWATSWAFSVYFLLTASTIFGAWRFQVNRLKMRQAFEMEHFEAEKLRELDQLKSHFFANISHEFRTPLTLIQGPLKQLMTGEFRGKLSDIYSTMLRNSQRLLQLINQLLDLSKLESGRLKLQVSMIDVSKFLKGLVQSFGSLADHQNITFTFHPKAEPITGYVDRDTLEKIINNLLSNAFKFTPAGGEIMVSVEGITDRACMNGKKVVSITISDTGPGIAPNRLERIFDRFYQVDDSNTRKREGTGIGLALTKELVELHHGEIKVNSQINKGSTFTVLLPLERKHMRPGEVLKERSEESFLPEKPEILIQSAAYPRVESTSKLNKSTAQILVVEDNIDVRNYIRSYLDQEYRIFDADEGKDGLQMAINKIPDLIISDIMMPKMDGVELCKRLKTDVRTSHIPVILLTAKADVVSRIEGLETGADDYVTKPFDARELQVRVKNLIEQRRRIWDHFKLEIDFQPSKIATTSMDEQFLERAIKIIDANLDNPDFSVEQYSQEIAMSRQHLYRKLKALTNHTPQGFIQNIRLKRAAKLLDQRTANVIEIAYAVGFSNPSHFAKRFRQQFGFSPSKWSNRHSSSD